MRSEEMRRNGVLIGGLKKNGHPHDFRLNIYNHFYHPKEMAGFVSTTIWDIGLIRERYRALAFWIGQTCSKHEDRLVARHRAKLWVSVAESCLLSRHPPCHWGESPGFSQQQDSRSSGKTSAPTPSPPQKAPHERETLGQGTERGRSGLNEKKIRNRTRNIMFVKPLWGACLCGGENTTRSHPDYNCIYPF